CSAWDSGLSTHLF
nr:immunoglobulin light chain junction region [Macaca mulatta]MPO04534.1 immunoglobulin light chain junction region [Macaca mulatta]MPO04652.1 immunoglobulin light chain junction region [Macaca mulatta]MPO05036.1 immunoglobulin light chain junction region [Macaca mulatta]MPO06185.1 immunoglobulin light chain junction region [Macaca mulatta]